VRARAANTTGGLGSQAYIVVQNNSDSTAFKGRYIQIEVAFNARMRATARFKHPCYTT